MGHRREERRWEGKKTTNTGESVRIPDLRDLGTRVGPPNWTATQVYYHSTGRFNNKRKKKIDLNKEKENEGRECRECDWGRGWRLGRGEEEERGGAWEESSSPGVFEIGDMGRSRSPLRDTAWV